MSRGRNRRISFPEPDDERPSALSADGLTVGPLLGEDGEDMGTYPFAVLLSVASPGLVLPLVAGFARAVSPGGRWRRRSSAIQVAGALRAFVREIVELYPKLDAIEGPASRDASGMVLGSPLRRGCGRAALSTCARSSKRPRACHERRCKQCGR